MSLFAAGNKKENNRHTQSLSEQLWLTKSLKRNKQKKSKQTETYLYTCQKASFTLEAVVALPLFIGFLVVFLFFFRVLQTEIKVQQVIAYTARMSAACTKNIQEDVSLEKIYLLLYAQMKKEKVSTEYIDHGILGISLTESKLNQKDITLHANYQMTVPIGFFGKLTHTVTQEVSARKWCGYIKGEEDSKKYVYVTETGEAYHNTKSCPYLDLSIHAIAASEVKRARNCENAKYKACSKCGKTSEKASVIYITDYGTVYHKKIGCSGLKRTIYMIPVEEAGTRHACKKCGG